jgi:hypothetical protein
MSLIILSNEDIELARETGAKRRNYDKARKIADRWGFAGKDGLKNDFQGCLGELAVARWLNVEWVGFSRAFKSLKYDAGQTQVRTTDHPNGRLLIHPTDPDDQPFILVKTNNLPEVNLVGWILGKNAKRKEWWMELQKGRPCYVVPNSELKEMENLREC